MRFSAEGAPAGEERNRGPVGASGGESGDSKVLDRTADAGKEGAPEGPCPREAFNASRLICRVSVTSFPKATCEDVGGGGGVALLETGAVVGAGGGGGEGGMYPG